LSDDWLTRLRAGLAVDPGMPDDGLTQSAVLVAFEPGLGESPELILTERAGHLRLHAGEVAFPGGKCDPDDSDHWQTALREAEEEVALQPGAVERIGVLPSLVTRFGMEVTPCIGLCRDRQALVANEEELASIFRAPLTYFADERHLEILPMEYRGSVRQVPRYEFDGYLIWGITAAILVRLANLACGSNLRLEDYWKGEKG
jgi:8-oxo-dGTP pyrophosphatase MutT (NUDIX family)